MIIVNLDVELAKEEDAPASWQNGLVLPQPISRFLRQARPRQSVLQHWMLFVKS